MSVSVSDGVASPQTAGKRDPQLEADVKEWIEAVIGQKWPAGGDYAQTLK